MSRFVPSFLRTGIRRLRATPVWLQGELRNLPLLRRDIHPLVLREMDPSDGADIDAWLEIQSEAFGGRFGRADAEHLLRRHPLVDVRHTYLLVDAGEPIGAASGAVSGATWRSTVIRPCAPTVSGHARRRVASCTIRRSATISHSAFVPRRDSIPGTGPIRPAGPCAGSRTSRSARSTRTRRASRDADVPRDRAPADDESRPPWRLQHAVGDRHTHPSGLLHLVVRASRRRPLGAHGYVLAVLLFPRSVPLLGLLAALGLANVVKLAPHHPNHILFEFFANGAIFTVIAVSLARRRWPLGGVAAAGGLATDAEARDALFETFAAPVRVSLLLLYGFAVLHELNWDFLDPQVSCGATMLAGLLARFGATDLPPWMGSVGIVGTLVIESAIPLCLAFSRTRSFGVALGLAFHVALTQYPNRGLPSFSSMLFAVFFLFTSPDLTREIGASVSALRTRMGGAARLRVGVVALVALLGGLGVATGFSDTFLLLVWDCYALAVAAFYGRFLWRYRSAAALSRALRPRPALLLVFPALVALNGASPCLGLKTRSSFSMFSNLRTEGGFANHLFLRSGIRLTDL